MPSGDILMVMGAVVRGPDVVYPLADGAVHVKDRIPTVWLMDAIQRPSRARGGPARTVAHPRRERTLDGAWGTE